MNTMDMDLMNGWLNQVAPFVPKGQEELAHQFGQLLQEKMQADRPEITIYGIYSHGKSTLINALLGTEAAQIGIRPTTDAVHRYPWRNFYLLDTPGIDAPIVHQQIAESQLAKSELVLFVLQSDEMEAQTAWEKLVSIAANGQKVILVINDFSGIRGDAEKSVRFKDRYRQNLQKEAEKQGVEAILEKIPLCIVNAKTALRAKLEGKGALLAVSGVTELETLVAEHTRAVSDDDVRVTLRRNFLSLLTLCEAGLCGAEYSELIKEGEQSLEDIRNTRGLAASNILHRMNALLQQHASQIKESFEVSKTENEVGRRLAYVMESLTMPLEEAIQTEMVRAQKRVETICTNFDKLSSIRLHGDPIDNAEPTVGSSLFDHAQKLPWDQILKEIKWDEVVARGIVKLLAVAKQWLPSLFKGIGAKTMEKWASTASAALGPILCIAGAVYEYYQSFKQEEELRQAIERKALAIAEAVTSVQDQVRTVFKAQVDAILDEAFLPVERALTQQLKQLKMKTIDNRSANDKLEQARKAFLEI